MIRVFVHMDNWKGKIFFKLQVSMILYSMIPERLNTFDRNVTSILCTIIYKIIT